MFFVTSPVYATQSYYSLRGILCDPLILDSLELGGWTVENTINPHFSPAIAL